MANKRSNTPADKGNRISRRGFIGASVVGGATTVLAPAALAGSSEISDKNQPKSTPPSEQKMEREVGSSVPPKPAHTVRRAASDLMVQVLRDLEIEYVALNPGKF